MGQRTNGSDDERLTKLVGMLDPLSDGQITAEGHTAFTKVTEALKERGIKWADIFNGVPQSEHQATLDTVAQFQSANNELKKSNEALIGENKRLRWRHNFGVKVGGLIGPKIVALRTAVSTTAFYLAFPVSYFVRNRDSYEGCGASHFWGSALWAAAAFASGMLITPMIQSAYTNYVFRNVEKTALVQALKENVPAGSKYSFVGIGPFHDQWPLAIDYKPDTQKSIGVNGQVSSDPFYRVDITATGWGLSRSRDRISLPSQNSQPHP